MNSTRCLCDRKTSFVQILRTTPVKTVCPNFYLLAHANGCAFSPRCSYCYLQASLWHTDGSRVFANLDDLLGEVDKWLAQDDLESFVLNTGNLSDSLCFEKLRPMLTPLVERFRQAEAQGRPHALLLVTKGGMQECEPLFAINPCANVIISFSVNHPDAAAQHEAGAAPSADRFAAARRLKEQGWRVRMRIDPIIAGFDYNALVEPMRELGPERITLGSLRAEFQLLRRAKIKIFKGLEKPADRKALARYPRAERLAQYRLLVDAFRDLCPIGLCEETPDIWQDLGLETENPRCNCAL